MAIADQVLGRLVTAGLVIHQHPAEFFPGDIAVDQHGGNVVRSRTVQHLLAACAGSHDQTFYVVADHLVNQVAQFLCALVGAGKEDRVPCLEGDVLQVTADFSKEGAGNIRRNHRNGVGTSAAQRSRRIVPFVSQALGHLEDPLGSICIHRAVQFPVFFDFRVHHERNQCHGDTCLARDITNGGFLYHNI